MPVNEIRDIIFENYRKRIGFSKESSFYLVKRLKTKDLLLLANRLKEKVPDPRNAKEHYESFLRKKNRKPIKQSEIITYQPETLDTVDIKSVITEHPKASHKLCKTKIQAEKVSSKSSVYAKTKKVKIFWAKKIVKTTKWEHAFKGYVSTYNVKILNFLNHELKGTESANKSKLIELLTQLKGFKLWEH